MTALRRFILMLPSALFALGAQAQINVSADFDTGNFGRVLSSDSSSMRLGYNGLLTIHTMNISTRQDPPNPVDTNLAPSSRWFHFRLDGVRDKMVYVTIPNTEVRRPFYSFDGMNYVRFDASENMHPQTVNKLFMRDTVYMSYFAPYTHAHHLEDMERWSCTPYALRETIGESGQGLPIEMLTVTDDSYPYEQKRKIWIHSREHTSEAPAAWHLAALVDELLGETPLAAEMRRRAVFYIVPECNPDGVEGGYSRSTASGINIEVNWNRPEWQTAPETSTLKRTIERLTSDRPMDAALNLHSQIAPHVTYWIHSAKSTSTMYFRREMLLSALTMNHTPYYHPGDQSFSEILPVNPEGWFWGRAHENTLALTFETPYTYYNNNPEGDWVDFDNLAQLAHASLLALSDMFDLGGVERKIVEAADMKQRGRWHEMSDDKLFFGDSYLVADRKGAAVNFMFGNMPAGIYDIYKWVPGPLTAEYPDGVNCWKPVGSVVQRRDGRLVWRYRAVSEGDSINAVAIVRRR